MTYTDQDRTALVDQLKTIQRTEGEGDLFWELIGKLSEIDKALKPYVINNRETIEANAGNYISLAGKGLLNGLDVRTKRDLFEIIAYDNEGNLVLHAYNARHNVYLPTHAQDQEYKIYSVNEYSKLPTNY